MSENAAAIAVGIVTVTWKEKGGNQSKLPAYNFLECF